MISSIALQLARSEASRRRAARRRGIRGWQCRGGSHTTGMRRSPLVFALLVLSTMSARASAPCVCATDVEILPAFGARDVPRNTKIWVVGGMLGPALLDGGGTSWKGGGKLVAGDSGRSTQQFDPGTLAPGESYAFRGIEYGPRTRFTTGAEDDVTPPTRPVLGALWIAVSEYGAASEPLAEIGFDAALDPDAALLRVTFTSARTQRSMITTTAGWRALRRPACKLALPFRPGEHVSVAVSAIDLAGNESPAVRRDVEIGRAAFRLPSCVRHQHRCMHMNPFMLFGATSVALAGLLGLIGYLVMHFRRVRDERLAVAEPISLLVAERLARAVQRRAGVIAAIGVVGVPALVVMDLGPLAIISTIVGCVGLRGFFITRAVLQLVEGAPRDATAELLGRAVIVRSASDEARLEVTPRAVTAARRHAVPTSIAHRR